MEPLVASLCITTEDVIAEHHDMQHWLIGKTANQRVLGSPNDMAFQLQACTR